MDVTAPEHAPIIAVPMYRQRVLELSSSRKAPPIGAIITAMNPGLDTMYPFLDKMQESMSRICYIHKHTEIEWNIDSNLTSRDSSRGEVV